MVLAEDTRVADELLRHHGLRRPLLSCHDHNEAERAPEVVERLRAGEDVALLSDAGMPLVSDPGYRVVAACVAAELPVTVLPGPCAAVTALAGSGLPVDRFLFAGFLPPKEGARREALAELGGVRATLVFYESPRRLPELLTLLAETWPRRPVVVARNLTKRHEQWLRGTAAEVRELLGDEERGEVTLLVGPAAEEALDDAAVEREITRLLGEGVDARQVRDRVAAWSGRPKREVYARVLAARGAAADGAS